MTSAVRLVKETEPGSVFDDQATKAMGEAFDAACKVLDEAGQSSVVYEAVAKCIIEMAKSGERDPNQLRDRALTACGHKRLIPLLPCTSPHGVKRRHRLARQVAVFSAQPLRISVRYRAPIPTLTQHQGRRFAGWSEVVVREGGREGVLRNPSFSASKSRTISWSKSAASGSVDSCSIAR